MISWGTAERAVPGTDTGVTNARCQAPIQGCNALQTEAARDDHALHLVGAFADLEDLLVAVEP